MVSLSFYITTCQNCVTVYRGRPVHEAHKLWWGAGCHHKGTNQSTTEPWHPLTKGHNTPLSVLLILIPVIELCCSARSFPVYTASRWRMSQILTMGSNSTEIFQFLRINITNFVNLKKYAIVNGNNKLQPF